MAARVQTAKKNLLFISVPANPECCGEPGYVRDEQHDEVHDNDDGYYGEQNLRNGLRSKVGPCYKRTAASNAGVKSKPRIACEGRRRRL